MSNNEKHQNEHEKKCFDIIKNNFSFRNCFGLTNEDFSAIEKYLEEIEPNEQSNEFPDFIFPNGFVELFRITSSKTIKNKGAAHKIAISNFQKKNEELAKKLSDQKPIYKSSFNYSGHSHPNLVKSFESIWNKHIKSLEKYSGKKDHGIFLVEYSDRGALTMAELSLEGVNEILLGDYQVRQEKTYNYRLSRDTTILKWLYQFKDRIEYVIFLTEEHVEFIKLSNIEKLLTVLPYDYAIAPNMTIVTSTGTLF